MTTRQRLNLDEQKAPPSWWTLALVCLSWIGLWYFTPGLHSNGIGLVLSNDASTAILIETGIAALILTAIVPLHQPYNRQLFARSKHSLFYALPLILAVILPFHYTLPLPLPVYMIWMAVSVFWQNYLTFGLLQSYLSERLPTWGVMGAVAVLFYLGHAVFIPERFAPTQILPTLGILGLGLVFSFMRAKLKALHTLFATHLAFYFIFA